MFTPPFCHWYVGVGLPLAVTENDTAAPGATVWLAGCVEIVGALVAVLTVRLAVAEVTLPALLVATTA